jgi:hypothetical protein
MFNAYPTSKELELFFVILHSKSLSRKIMPLMKMLEIPTSQ